MTNAFLFPGACQRRQRQPDALAADALRPFVEPLLQQRGMIAGHVDDDFIDVEIIVALEGVEKADTVHLERPTKRRRLLRRQLVLWHGLLTVPLSSTEVL